LSGEAEQAGISVSPSPEGRKENGDQKLNSSRSIPNEQIDDIEEPNFPSKRNLYSPNTNSSPFPFFCLQLPANRLPLNH
jgi:hypothetical protein